MEEGMEGRRGVCGGSMREGGRRRSTARGGMDGVVDLQGVWMARWICRRGWEEVEPWRRMRLRRGEGRGGQGEDDNRD
jgi:hypothetical protein